MKNNLVFFVRAATVEEADRIAKVNGMQFAELFTRKYKDCLLHVDPDGKVIRNMDEDKSMPHFITDTH